MVADAGVLGSEASRVDQAVTQLQDSEGLNLYVIYVDEFSDPSDMDAWVQDVARKKGLGTTDSVLAIATDARQLRLKSSDNGEIAAHDADIVTEYITPDLRSNTLTADDWASASSGGSAAPWIIGGVIVVGGGTLWVLGRRKKSLRESRRPRSADTAPRDPLASLSIEELRHQAGPLLIAADDAIRSSEQELNFALAEFGEEAIKPFAADLAKAKEHLGESFKLQQQLDDSIPDSEADQRQWLGTIIHRCEAVNDSLEEHREDFASLRELERKLPQATASLRSHLEVLRTDLQTAKSSLTGLAQRYADSALLQVRDNVEQADELIDFIEDSLKTAAESSSDSSEAEAAVAIRAGEEAVDQTRVLIAAIGKTGTSLGQASEDVESQLAEAHQDLTQAQSLGDAGQHQELAAPAAVLKETIGRIEEARHQGRVDPGDLLSRLARAREGLDGPLGAIRDRREQTRRAAASLQSALQTARGKIDGTDDFIRARRGGVGATARTRLAEAQRY
ncbi:MAG: TPM domain-containing protein, partial [Micrococcaceae bacterium]|nr:TPM domain-containing protein [Micrococcaceae bacterium]